MNPANHSPAQGGTPFGLAWPRALLGLAAVLLLVLGLYHQTAWAMVQIWNRSETFAHAFTVPPIALWLIWRQRAALALVEPRPSPWFLLPLAACGSLWLLGDLAAVNAATQLALVGMLVFAVPLCLGSAAARVIAFPLAFFFFAVPIGEFLMPLFMDWTADFTVSALRLSGIPVYREGLQFVIPSGNWSVVEACSGIRYLMASVMVGALFAYLNYRSVKRRVIFVIFAILLPVVANWVRAYLTVLLGHVSGNKLATGADHLLYGWVFFGIIMLAMFMVGARWAEPDAPAPEANPGSSMPGLPRRLSASAVVTLVSALALVLLPFTWSQRLSLQSPKPDLVLSLPAGKVGSWQVAPGSPVMLKPVFQAPAGQTDAVYRKGDRQLGLHLAYYRQQSYSSKLISSVNTLVTSEDRRWSAVSQGAVVLQEPAIRLRRTELRNVQGTDSPWPQRLDVWQVYWINGQTTSSDSRAKLFGLWHRLMGQGDDAAALTLYTDRGDNGSGEAALREFVQENWAALDAALRKTRDGQGAVPAASP
ncbi:exosortase A [Paucibacter sp. DJ2R-2]|uniref:exosortase A n=1 Tax=Paucibacter sp. DJ2R-2 TaxID=2893558 RepID=UPI0021E5079A|nr:exosortase A [Paucibacter sp. DJ2R-2]MCV2420649.1 exosortase A [Paucibacter sp. DJ4R-1]MCV2439827.1 exosortase A [Paucibacter sp. DJ2R-2]